MSYVVQVLFIFCGQRLTLCFAVSIDHLGAVPNKILQEQPDLSVEMLRRRRRTIFFRNKKMGWDRIFDKAN